MPCKKMDSDPTNYLVLAAILWENQFKKFIFYESKILLVLINA